MMGFLEGMILEEAREERKGGEERRWMMMMMMMLLWKKPSTVANLELVQPKLVLSA